MRTFRRAGPARRRCGIRSPPWLIAAGIAASAACSSIETGVPGGSGGGGSGADGGTSGGGVDGGSGGGAGSDAGPDGGSDAGPSATNDCDGLAPASLGTMASHAEQYDSTSGICGLPVGNGAGVMAHFVSGNAYPRFTLVNPSGGLNGRVDTVAHGGIIPLASGFLEWSFSQFRGIYEEQFIGAVDDSGKPQGTGNLFYMYDPREELFGIDMNGGAAHAGTSHLEGRKDQRRVEMFDATGKARWGPRDLPTDTAIFGLGVDLNDRTLVIQDGYAQCSGCILAQWFERDGTPLGSFTLLTGFSAGPATWFETAPLIDGGLAVRRMDADRSSQTQGFHSQWLVTVGSGTDTIEPAPDWMKARPDTNLALARGRTAYAVLPNGGFGQPCTQDVELMSRNGNSCARWSLELASGRTCDTLEVRLGLDGTILQRLPFELESNTDGSGRTKTCTVRFWPAALK
jgi:hypothetical protein